MGNRDLSFDVGEVEDRGTLREVRKEYGRLPVSGCTDFRTRLHLRLGFGSIISQARHEQLQMIGIVVDGEASRISIYLGSLTPPSNVLFSFVRHFGSTAKDRLI